MVFSSMMFLLFYLPAVLAVYYLAPNKLKNLVLFVFSLLFYAWGEPVYVGLMIFSTVLDYTCGLTAERFRGTRKAKIALLVSVVVNLSLLGVFKYAHFLIATVNSVFGCALPLLGLPLPIGISFYTFQTMSYTIDVYRGDTKAQRNIISFGAYVSLFPQLIAGPIVRYQTIAEQMDRRTHSSDQFSLGVRRFVCGLAKKVLLANNIGLLWNTISQTDAANLTVLSAWLGLIAFSFQIYFDFSGYSDIAIGLSGMLGFPMKENFNFPYLSRSITEFWRRWHISLGTWFREYIYIPLGGSRQGKKRTVLNVLTVFLLTGIWHGAGLGYFLWGMINGVCNVIEKLIGEKKFYKKTPGLVKWLFTTLITFFSWELFRFGKLSLFNDQLMIMFGLKRFTAIPYTWRYYLDAQIVTLAVIGALGATVWGLPKIRNAYLKFTGTKTGYLINQLVFVLLFIISVMFMVSSQYSPFIYFRY